VNFIINNNNNSNNYQLLLSNMKHSISLPALASLDLESDASTDSSIEHNTSASTVEEEDEGLNDAENGETHKMSRVHSQGYIPSSPKSLASNTVTPHTGYKKVLVTGGAGFIGSHVAQTLLSRGDDVVIVDEVNDYYDTRIKESNLKLLQAMSTRVKIYKGDICDTEFITDLFEHERPTFVCHMAARAGVRPSIQDPFIYIHSNIKGTTQLMELSARYNVQNFVFASSSSVYGGSKSTFFSEEEVVDNPVSPYAASKKACELLAYTYHHLYNLNISALRFFTVYGPRGRPDMAPFKFIDRVSRGLEIQQFGDGSSSRDYTYISDIVDGIIRSLDRPYKYEVFNLGKGSGTSLKEFIDLVQKYTQKKANIKVLPDQAGDVPYTCADVSKAYHLLGYKAKVSFERGIAMTAAWYKETYGDNSMQKNKSNLICPETQANGLGRAPSFVDLTRATAV